MIRVYASDLLEVIEDLLYSRNLKENKKYKTDEMKKGKIPVPEFMIWFIRNFPNSHKIIKKDSAFIN